MTNLDPVRAVHSVRRPLNMPAWGFWLGGCAVIFVLAVTHPIGFMVGMLLLVGMLFLWAKTPRAQAPAVPQASSSPQYFATFTTADPLARLDPGSPVPSIPQASDATLAGYVRLNSAGEQKVVGENYYQRSLRSAYRVVDPGQATAALVPEPDNPHDSSAVRVDIVADGKHYKAGYIPRERAAAFAAALQALGDTVGVVPAKLWRSRSGHVEVYLRCSRPESLVHVEVDDPDGVLLEGNADLAVLGVNAHQEALAGYREGAKQAFGLTPGVVPTGKYAGADTFMVNLRGQPIGYLSRAMALKHERALNSVLDKGKTPHFAGSIRRRGSSYKVTLRAPMRAD